MSLSLSKALKLKAEEFMNTMKKTTSGKERALIIILVAVSLLVICANVISTFL